MGYTKGPWTKCKSDATIILDKDSDNPESRIIARIWDNRWKSRNVYDDNWKEAHANAHLIASAPDLLEACKEIFNYYGDLLIFDDSEEKSKHDDIMTRLYDLIAKAEGRE